LTDKLGVVAMAVVEVVELEPVLMISHIPSRVDREELVEAVVAGELINLV